MADLDISIYESVGLAEYIASGDIPIRPYDSISVSDVVTIQPYLYFYTDPREGRNPAVPVYDITADFGFAFSAEDGSHAPDSSIEACFGGELDEVASEYSGIGSMSQYSYSLSLDANSPDYQAYSIGGAILTGRAPNYSISSQFAQELYASLTKTAPNWEAEATIHADLSFTLDKNAPVWIDSIFISQTEEAGITLDRNAPVGILRASMYEQGNFTLDKIAPNWKIETLSYVQDFNLDSTVPAWIIEAVQDAAIAEADRFSDYILRWVRP